MSFSLVLDYFWESKLHIQEKLQKSRMCYTVIQKEMENTTLMSYMQNVCACIAQSMHVTHWNKDVYHQAGNILKLNRIQT
jgi:hypothetical protein